MTAASCSQMFALQLNSSLKNKFLKHPRQETGNTATESDSHFVKDASPYSLN